MNISSRKIIFLAGWVGIPLFFWLGRIEPALERSNSARATKEGSDESRDIGRRSISRRDRLETEWNNFRKQADIQLANLDTDLHPHLVQKRVFELAARLDLDIDIQEESGDGRRRFSLRGEGSWDSFISWIDALEKGPHRIRFENLQLTLPEERYSDRGGTRIEALFAIPHIEKDSTT
ncbi:MAG TPA: hypothetical protein DDW23_04295 [Planctomycetes bacterium]|jgi:hypothetical protein|nr:hypothetical protein [Planctomycetota bacterium]